MSRSRVGLAAGLLLLIACSGDDAVDDAGVVTPDGDVLNDGGPMLVTPPAEAGLPILTPCPTGWRQMPMAEGPTRCEPWPDGGPADCSVGEAHFAGGDGCSPVGTACPTGLFADDLPAGTVFVDASASAGGAGTEGSPFSTIDEARAMLPVTGAVIALARGVHDSEVRVETGDLTIIGACAAQTTLTRTAGMAPRAIASARGGQLTLRNLRLTGAEIGVASVIDATSRLVVEGVQIDGTKTSAGVAFDGAQLVVRDSVVRDTLVGSEAGELGRAFQPVDGAEITLERVVIERVRDVAVVVVRASASLTDVVIAEVGQTMAGTGGRAVELFGASDVTLSRVVVEDAGDVAILVGDVGTILRAEDLLVRRIDAASSSLTAGRGLEVIQGARAELSRAVFDEPTSIGVFVRGEATTVVFEDVVIAGTRPRSDGTFGRGLETSLGATSTFTRTYVANNRDVGMLLTDGASMTATDLVVHATESELATRTVGAGITVQEGASLDVTRLRLSENRSHGLLLIGQDTTVDSSDVTVVDTRSWEEGGIAGVGIGVQNGARLTLSRGHVARNREAGILSLHDGTVVRLEDVTVVETQNRECVAAGSCEQRSTGMAAVEGGQLSASRFLIADGEVIGVQVAVRGQMDLSNGLIRGHPIGAAVGIAGYDIMRLSVDVAYTDNGVNLDASELPIPGSANPFVGAPR